MWPAYEMLIEISDMVCSIIGKQNPPTAAVLDAKTDASHAKDIVNKPTARTNRGRTIHSVAE